MKRKNPGDDPQVCPVKHTGFFRFGYYLPHEIDRPLLLDRGNRKWLQFLLPKCFEPYDTVSDEVLHVITRDILLSQCPNYRMNVLNPRDCPHVAKRIHVCENVAKIDDVQFNAEEFEATMMNERTLIQVPLIEHATLAFDEIYLRLTQNFWLKIARHFIQFSSLISFGPETIVRHVSQVGPTDDAYDQNFISMTFVNVEGRGDCLLQIFPVTRIAKAYRENADQAKIYLSNAQVDSILKEFLAFQRDVQGARENHAFEKAKPFEN